MKVLRIRGENLASLPAFDVDFQGEVLGPVGLFAITGPTGSGKSTLLDALSLALYGRTPRLGGRKGAKLKDGTKDVLASDPRLILRRGTGKGWCEVTFTGRRGEPLRARWEVYRSREKPGGLLQKVKTFLLEVVETGEVLADGTAAMKEVVPREVGLTYDQFCRSVLLAQGDFAAFLKAEPKERAELLERLTGEEVYGELSRAAYQRAKAADEELKLLEAKLGQIQVLEPEQRAAREKEEAQGAARVKELLEQQKALAAELRWYQQLERLGTEVAEAEKKLAETAKDWEQAAPRRELLERLERLAPFREKFREKARVEEERTKAARDLEETEKRRRETETEKAGRAAEHARAVRERNEAEAWIEAHPVAASLAEDWRLVLDRLQEYENAGKRLEVLSAEREEHQSGAETRQAAKEAAEEARQEAEVRLQQARKEEEAAGKAAEAFDREALRSRRKRLEARRSVHGELGWLRNQAREQQLEIAELRKLAETSRAEAAEHEAARAREKEALGRLQGRLEEARRQLEQLRSRLELGDHRARLQEGEECPLCGSREHPFREDGAAVEDITAEARARLDELEKEDREAQAGLAALIVRHRGAMESANEATRKADAREEKRSKTCARWAEELAREGAPSMPADPLAEEVETALEELGEELDREAVELDAEEERAAAATRSREDARKKVEEARSARDERKQAVAEAEKALGESARILEKNLEEQVRRQEVRELCLEKLSEEFHPIDGWREELLADAAAFRTRWSEQVEEFGNRRKVREAREKTRVLLEEKQAGLGDMLGEIDKQLTAARAREREQAALLKSLEAELEAAFEKEGLEPREARELLARDEAWLEGEAAAVRRLDEARKAAATRLEDREARRKSHREGGAPGDPREVLEERAAALEKQVEEAQREHRALEVLLRGDEENRRRREEAGTELRDQEARAKVWKELGELIGSADGKKFREFAQGLTLGLLLDHANRHLEDLAPRYRLERVPGADMALQVVDRDMGDEVRSVNSLSGGEGFLASLALALGLSSLTAEHTRIESLFIDEGFGTLDTDTLDTALATLDGLQASGNKQVGVISHVPGLAEQVGARVEVRPLGAGSSEVRVLGL